LLPQENKHFWSSTHKEQPKRNFAIPYKDIGTSNLLP